jgi:chromosome segregation ATPase
MINLSQVNAKLKSREKRTHQNVSREQIECGKLAQKVAKLTAKIGKLSADLKEAKEQASRKTNEQAEVTSLVVPRKRKDLVSG